MYFCGECYTQSLDTAWGYCGRLCGKEIEIDWMPNESILIQMTMLSIFQSIFIPLENWTTRQWMAKTNDIDFKRVCQNVKSWHCTERKLKWVSNSMLKHTPTVKILHCQPSFTANHWAQANKGVTGKALGVTLLGVYWFTINMKNGERNNLQEIWSTNWIWWHAAFCRYRATMVIM